jgi:hypothetical protein
VNSLVYSHFWSGAGGGGKETAEMVYCDKYALDPLSKPRGGSKPGLERRPSEVDAAAKAAAATQESELARGGGVVDGGGSVRATPAGGRRRMSHIRIPMAIKGLSPGLLGTGTRRLAVRTGYCSVVCATH